MFNIIIDTIPNGTSFINYSVTVGGITQIGANPQTGVLLGTISPNQVVTVTFKVIVNC